MRFRKICQEKLDQWGMGMGFLIEAEAGDVALERGYHYSPEGNQPVLFDPFVAGFRDGYRNRIGWVQIRRGGMAGSWSEKRDWKV